MILLKRALKFEKIRSLESTERGMISFLIKQFKLKLDERLINTIQKVQPYIAVRHIVPATIGFIHISILRSPILPHYYMVVNRNILQTDLYGRLDRDWFRPWHL